MSILSLAIHIGLLAIAVAIMLPAAMTLFALLIWEVTTPPRHAEPASQENNGH